MKLEISKTTLEHLIGKYPNLTEGIIEYFFFCGKIKKEILETYPLNKYEYMYKHYYILHLPKHVAEEFNVDEKLDLIPNEDGVIYTIYINQ